MLFTHLVDLIHTRFDLMSCIGNAAGRVNIFLFCNSESDVSVHDNLYVFNAADYLSAPEKPINSLIICSEDSQQELLDSLRGSGRNVLFCRPEMQTEVLNFVQLVLNRSLKESDNYSVFLQMIISGRDLSYVLSEAARQCGGQLVAIDFSGKVLAHSSPWKDIDPEWRMFIKEGYCPADHMQHFYSRLLQRKEISILAYSYRCEDTGIYYLSCPIVINGYAHGYVFTLSTEELKSPLANDITQIMSRVAADYIRRNDPEVNSHTQLYRRLVVDILGGESREAIADRLTSGKFSLPSRMRTMFVKPLYYSCGDLLKTLGSQLSAVFNAAPPIQYRDGLMLLLPADSAYEDTGRAALAFLDKLSVANHLRTGISNVFNTLQDLPQYYAQSREAIALADRLRLTKHTILYSDVAFFSLIGHLSEGAHIRDFCHPALAALSSYDRENGTELFDTARVYVETNCNQKETAERLHTHRNTISYRKQQIQQITGIDFQNTEELFQLRYSFKIYAYLAA